MATPIHGRAHYDRQLQTLREDLLLLGSMAEKAVELSVETNYPWQGAIAVTVEASPDAPWTLSLRIPSWAHGATVDGQTVAAGDYARITRNWQAGERVLLELDMAPRLTVANPRVDAIRGCVAVERGPIVYCFEAADLPDGVQLADVALAGGARPADSGTLAELGGVPAVAITGLVAEADQTGASQALYADAGSHADAGSGAARSAAAAPQQLQAIPYFTWANRGSGAMRVWVPVAESA